MIDQLISFLHDFSQRVPLEAFVFLGTVIEEVIAPIPSPLVMTLAGSIAASQGHTWLYLILICAIGTLGKTFGAWIFYVLGDKIEDLLIPRFGKYIGVSHHDLENFGNHFSGTWKDEVILILLRCIPMMPSTPISVVCGVLKITTRAFLMSTYIGFFIRNLFFLALGYTGLGALDSLMSGIDTVETILKILVVGGTGLILAWLYWKRRTGHPAHWFRFGKKKE